MTKAVPTLFFVVSSIVLWVCVNFCNYMRQKYCNIRIMKMKQKFSINKKAVLNRHTDTKIRIK